MLQFKRPRYDELADTLKLLIAFREEFADIYPEADIAKVAITIEEHFNNGFICNAYFNNKIVGSVGAMPSEWWVATTSFWRKHGFMFYPSIETLKRREGF